MKTILQFIHWRLQRLAGLCSGARASARFIVRFDRLPGISGLLSIWTSKRRERRAPDGAAPKAAGKPPDKIAPQPERSSFSDDDSPPGHKIRWHL
jgi:hypothetical protein